MNMTAFLLPKDKKRCLPVLGLQKFNNYNPFETNNYEPQEDSRV